MAISLASLKTSTHLTPPAIIVHGVAGVGKTTFAADSDKAVAVCTEDGLGVLKIPHFPLARSFEEVVEALAALHSEPHEHRTLVVDSLDWLEPLVWQHACKINNWSTIEEPGYGKGYIAALDLWRQYLDWINALREDRRMMVVRRY